MDVAPLLMASVVGFTHAFEADHLVAVSAIVTRRNNSVLAIKDGIYWGLGHTSTILLVGSLFLLGRFFLREDSFRYAEAGVGLMLIGLGAYRLYCLFRNRADALGHPHPHEHKLAYGVGLVHGLAGSGALIFSVLATIREALGGMVYLMVFGLGSIGGMMVAAGLFSVPLSEKLMRSRGVRVGLTLLSSLLCIGLGGLVVYDNLW